MKQIICTQFADGWMELLEHLCRSAFTQPRGLRCYEEDCVAFRLVDLRNNILVHPARKMNYRFMVAEWLWVLRGRNDLASLAEYNSKMTAFSDDGIILAGAYGPKLQTQWEYILGELRHRDTRRAVATIWTPVPEPSKDIPCTVALQWLLRDSQLNCIVTMRSSDIWLGLPYDMFVFSQITSNLAASLQVETGWIQFNLGSSHLYEEHWHQAKDVTDNSQHGLTLRSPRLAETNKYQIVLLSKTSAEALEILNRMSKL